MAIKYSKILQVEHAKFEELGVFDAFIHIDTPLYLDPFLLKNTSVPELQGSYQKMTQHFQRVFRYLARNQVADAVQLLLFKEMPFISLGCAASGKTGSGVGIQLATHLTQTVQTFAKQGIKDPQIFEVMGLFEDKIGPDRISDMTISLIYDDLLAYTARVAKEIQLITKPFLYQGKKYLLPYDGAKSRNDNFLVFVPKVLLREIPASLEWQDHESLISNRNPVAGATWKELMKSKEKFRNFLLQDPRWLTKLIQRYNEKKVTPYNFKEDPRQFFKWEDKADSYVAKCPIKIPPMTVIKNQQHLFDLTTILCLQIEKMIKTKGFDLLLRNLNLKERTAQLMIYEIFEQYRELNQLPFSVQFSSKESIIVIQTKDENKKSIQVLVGVKFGHTRNTANYRTALAQKKASIFLEIEQRFLGKKEQRLEAGLFPADTLHLYKKFLVNQGF